MSNARRFILALTCVVFTLCVSHAPLMACSVCQGDPDSGMTKGAKAGVIFMVVVTYALLSMFGGMMAVWFVRARRLKGL